MTTKAERAAQAAERAEYASELRNLLPEHATIYTTAEYASSRATTAHVSLHAALIREDGTPYIHRLTYAAAKAMGETLSDRNGIRYGGWGYSKEFQAVYSLSRALFPDGYTCTGPNCKSNDHFNGSPRDGVMHHNDGGYYYSQSSL